MKNKIGLCIVTAVCLIMMMTTAQAIDRDYVVTNYEVQSSGVKENMRIILLADMHGIDYSQQLTEDISQLAPDLILWAGDMINYNEKDFSILTQLGEALSTIAPVYAIAGNHEEVLLKRKNNFSAEMKRAGVQQLLNDDDVITVGANTVEIVGVRGTSVSKWKKGGGRDEMRSLNDCYDGFRICMAHVPALFDNGLEFFEYDLAVAGHVQGGVAQIPGIGGLFSSEEGLFPKFSAGIYDLPNNGKLVVSKGLGASEEWYIRINNTQELVVIDVVPGTDDKQYCRIVNAEGNVNVRKEPSLDADIVETTHSGAKHVLVGENENGWFHVRVHGQDGYVFGDFVEVMDALEQ